MENMLIIKEVILLHTEKMLVKHLKNTIKNILKIDIIEAN